MMPLCEHDQFSLTKCRRFFLKAVGQSLGLSFISSIAARDFFQKPGLSENLRKELGDKLLDMINEERSLAGVSTLAVDHLATVVATAHALDMAKGRFASHWGSDGRKPYQRYSFAGGIHATAETVSSADNTWSLKPTDISQDVAYLHVRMYGETAPDDWHRRTILAPQHTHVGFGIAIEGLSLRVVELFVAKYIEVDPVERRAKPGMTFPLRGRVLNQQCTLKAIEVFYEPLPKPPDIEWLRTARTYSLPDESLQLRPKLPAPLIYVDGSRGVIEIDGCEFFTHVKLFKTGGIYTIVCWLKKDGPERPFQATQICIQAE